MHAKCPDQIGKEAFDVLCCLGARLEELASKFAGERCTFFTGHLTLVCLVALVSYEHKDGLGAFDAYHRLAEGFQSIKRCTRRD